MSRDFSQNGHRMAYFTLCLTARDGGISTDGSPLPSLTPRRIKAYPYLPPLRRGNRGGLGGKLKAGELSRYVKWQQSLDFLSGSLGCPLMALSQKIALSVLTPRKASGN